MALGTVVIFLAGNKAGSEVGKSSLDLLSGNNYKIHPAMGIAPSVAGVADISSSEATFENTSLRDTGIDRAAVVMENGKVILNGGILFYFDYFLNLQGEMDMEAIRLLLQRDLNSNYPAGIARFLYALFERYLAYLDAVGQRMNGVSASDLAQQGISVREWENRIRHEFFSEEEVAQLFGSYEKMLAAPAKATESLRRLEEYEQAVAENPASQEAVAIELFGIDAANRLQVLQQERKKWQQRLIDYGQQKDAILNTRGMDDYSKEQAIGLLRQRLFSETEQRRVSALERSKLAER